MAYVNVVKVPLLKLGRAELRLNVDTSSSHSEVFYGIASHLDKEWLEDDTVKKFLILHCYASNSGPTCRLFDPGFYPKPYLPV
jgi:hypothetical protein